MDQRSSSFELLDKQVQRWVWKQGWTSLKDIQENAIPIVLAKDSDVIISAATAGGKTEAAFLPIVTSILKNRSSHHTGYSVLYISPLKALINDQYRRLQDMVADMAINVTPWHGDINTSKKNNSLKNPNGILIITPESLESFLINRKEYLDFAFSSLQYVVIDELHSFIGTERGKQLQSLLARLEHVANKHIPRIAMSATFSNYNIVKMFLRNDGSLPCKIPPQGETDHEIKLLIKEYISNKDQTEQDEIALETYSKLRGSNNLVFVNSRQDAEQYAVLLGELCDKNNVPNEFRIHHGSLSKSIRDNVEKELQSGEFPITAICTSTMELGVDIGKVKSIAQISVAHSVAGLRQRLGRSGRRNDPSILRVFSIDDEHGILHDLRSRLVQNISIIELLREHQYEEPRIDKYHLSTLIQQILSTIVQFGAFYPKDGWVYLCQKGAFNNVDAHTFLLLLKDLGSKDVISQLNNSQIVIGKLGETIVRSIDFYTAFVTPVDYSVIDKSSSKMLGVIQKPAEIGEVIILSARRWIVKSVDDKNNNIYVEPIRSGGKTRFLGDGIEVDRLISQKMYDVYTSTTEYPYLDGRTNCQEHLGLARRFVKYKKIDTNVFVEHDNNELMFTWAGTIINRTIALCALYYLDIECEYTHLYITNLNQTKVADILSKGKPSAVELASIIGRTSKITQKYDCLLSDYLLNVEYASNYLDVDECWNYLEGVSNS